MLRKFKDSGARNSGASGAGDVEKYQCYPIENKDIGVGNSGVGKAVLKEAVRSL
jgi:hypothetical protein